MACFTTNGHSIDSLPMQFGKVGIGFPGVGLLIRNWNPFGTHGTGIFTYIDRRHQQIDSR